MRLLLSELCADLNHGLAAILAQLRHDCVVGPEGTVGGGAGRAIAPLQFLRSCRREVKLYAAGLTELATIRHSDSASQESDAIELQLELTRRMQV